MSSRTGVGGLHIPTTAGGRWRWGLSLGRSRTSHEGVRARATGTRRSPFGSPGRSRVPAQWDTALCPLALGGQSGGAQTPEDAWSPEPGRSNRQGQGRESRSLETKRTGRRPDADDGAGVSGEGIGSGWERHVRHWAGLSISGVDGPRYGWRHSGPYRALHPWCRSFGYLPTYSFKNVDNNLDACGCYCQWRKRTVGANTPMRKNEFQ
jgi:hypothetical protein